MVEKVLSNWTNVSNNVMQTLEEKLKIGLRVPVGTQLPWIVASSTMLWVDAKFINLISAFKSNDKYQLGYTVNGCIRDADIEFTAGGVTSEGGRLYHSEVVRGQSEKDDYIVRMIITRKKKR